MEVRGKRATNKNPWENAHPKYSASMVFHAFLAALRAARNAEKASGRYFLDACFPNVLSGISAKSHLLNSHSLPDTCSCVRAEKVCPFAQRAAATAEAIGASPSTASDSGKTLEVSTALFGCSRCRGTICLMICCVCLSLTDVLVVLFV